MGGAATLGKRYATREDLWLDDHFRGSPPRRQATSDRTDKESQFSDTVAKVTIYRALIESDLEVPKHLARPLHDLYFPPEHEEFQPRTLWSLSNAFTSAFKQLEPIPQFRATAKLAGFLERQ